MARCLEMAMRRLLHLSPLAGRGRFASGAMAKRSKSGEGACPQAQARGYAPSPGFLRCARNPTSPRTRQGYRIWLAAGRCQGAPSSPSPRLRGEVDLRAEPWRSEANRVRGLVHKLRLAATPPHPDSFAALGIRPLPARGRAIAFGSLLGGAKAPLPPLLPACGERSICERSHGEAKQIG